MDILRKPSLPLLLVTMATALFSAATHAGTPAGDSAAYRLESWPREASANLASKALDTAADAALSAYIQVRSARFGGWDDSSGMYIGSQLGRLPQLYRVTAPGADRRPMTFFSKRMSTFDVNPDPRKKLLLFTQDAGGDEEFRLGLFDLATGTSRILDCPPGRVEGVLWNDSGTAFAYAHTPKGAERWDIRIHRIGPKAEGGKAGLPGHDEGNGQDTLVLERPGTWLPMDFSPDGKSLLIQKYVSASEAAIHVLDLSSGSLKPLSPRGSASFEDNAHFVRGSGTAGSGSGKGKSWAVCFTSDRDGEFNRLYLARANVGPGPSRPAPPPGKMRLPEPAYSIEALSPPAPWDVEWVEPGPDRGLLIYSLNEDGISRLYSLEPGAPRPTKARLLPGIPEGLIDGIHFRAAPEKTRPARPPEFAFTAVSATFPGDVFTYRLDKDKVVRWTFSETGGLPARAFRNAQLIRYPTFDSTGPEVGASSQPPSQPRRLPAWLYLPDSSAAHPPFPVLILIHGGPESQARPGFDSFVQYAAGHLGLAVIQPNVRGSSGYGKTFLKADDGFNRMQSVRDIGALLDWIKTRPDLDSTRVAVAGRSYGGFMALSTLIEYGPRLRAGISTVGITHFPTFLQKTSGYRRDLRRAEYGDERDPRMAAFLDSISPLTRLDRIRSPLLLCHGRNDPRVPYQESERIFGALKSKGVPVWFLTFEGEGHGVRDQDNQTVQYRTMAGFLSRELGLKPLNQLY